MRALLLLLLLPASAAAQQITPAFTQGSMSATTVTTQTINEVVAHEVMGAATSTWSGQNVAPSTDITDGTATWDVVTAGDPWQLEITTRAAGIVETIDITRDITTDSTTNSLSVFSQ